MPERFDFNYWPPRPVEQPAITPAQSSLDEEICYDLLLVQDDDRRQAVYATGDWADIQDFWLEAVKPPRAKDVEAETIVQPFSNEPQSGFKLLNRRYLRTSAFAFRRTSEEVARLDGEMHRESPLFQLVKDEFDANVDPETAAENFLSEFVFNRRDARFLPHQLLIARRALVTMYDEVPREDINPWPADIGNDAELIIAKVALRWHENFLENSLK